MLPDTRDWMDGLWHFVAHHRLGKPLVSATPEAEQTAERGILCPWFDRWLADLPANLAARRAWVAGGDREAVVDPDPGLVLTTAAVAVAAAGERLLAAGMLPNRGLAITELEYRLWCIRHPDDGRQRHVNVWNWIKTRVPEQRHDEFARHPLGPGECYWLHRAGSTGCGDADHRECHLWRWDGRDATLLEGFVTERSVTELS